MKRLLLPVLAAGPLAAQGPASAAGVIFDGYYFGSDYGFRHVVEWTVPVALSQRLASGLTLDLSTAYARAAAATRDGTLEIAGSTDTDVRLSWAAASGRLAVSVAGTLPTGKKAVSDSTIPLLSALATDLLAFTTPSFGSGGGLTGGLATAFPLGERWSAGVGASYRWHASYTPIAGSGDLEPGGEGRVRLGAEGPLGSGGYFRGAAIYTASGADTLNGGARSISGDRVLVYASASLPAGGSSLALYAYDMHRFRPRAYNSTNRNAVQVPRGNVLAWGGRLDRPLSPAWTLAPNAEFRHELAAPDSGSMELLGWLVRPGVDLRFRASGSVSVVFQTQVAFGRVAHDGGSVSLLGPRGVLLMEWSR